MNTFLWTMVVLGLIEFGSSMAYWAVGRVPERTVTGAVINGLLWLAFAYWAFSLTGQ